PEILQEMDVAQRVHALPEAIMPIRHELAFPRQPLHRLQLPRRRIAVDVIEHLRLEHKEAAVDPAGAYLRLFGKVKHARVGRVVGEDQLAEAGRRVDGGDRGQFTMAAVEGDELLNVYV